MAFFAWQYRQIDALRPDDSPWQVMALYGLLLAFELALVALTIRLFGADMAAVVGEVLQ
jgi:hypothetical protein